MDFERFESNRAKYGQCSSWAVWNQGTCEYLRFEGSSRFGVRS